MALTPGEAQGTPAGDSDAPRQASACILYVPHELVDDPEIEKEIERLRDVGSRALRLALDTDETGASEIRLDSASPASGDGSQLRGSLGKADLLELRGGDFIDWYKRVYPPGRPTHLARGLQNYLHAKRPLLAFGGACQFLSGGLPVDSKRLEAELGEDHRNPRDQTEHRARLAFGVGPRAIFDSDAWPGSSPLRLLKALERTRVDLGFFTLGQVALHYDRTRKELRALGSGQVLVLDLRGARRQKDGIRGMQLHRLRSGDRWRFVYDQLQVAPERLEQPQAFKEAEVRQRASAESAALTGVQSGSELIAWLESQADQPVLRRQRSSSGGLWTTSWSAQSQRYGSGSDSTLVNWPLSIRWAGR